MSAPMYYSKASKIGVVIEGEGHFEMATPHTAQGHKKKSSPTYERVSAHLRPGVVFVVPAGHPFVTLASPRNNLQILCFEVNARGNKKLTFAGIRIITHNVVFKFQSPVTYCFALLMILTGKKNIVNAMDKEAKELVFNLPAEKVDNIFNREEQFFFAGPENYEEPEERGRAYA